MGEAALQNGTGLAAKLGTLAERINDEHRAHEAAVKAALWQMSAALDHAMGAGDLLIEVKAVVGHGNWKAWVRENCEVSVRRAQEYKYLAERRDKVEEESKARNGASFTSIRAGLDFLRRTRYTGEGWFQQESELPTPQAEKEPTPAAEKRQRAKERERARKERRLTERAAYAIRTGDVELPVDVAPNPAAWGYAIDRVLSLREQNMPTIIDLLAHHLDTVVRQADPEAVGRYLVEPRNDPDEAEARNDMLAELRAALPWLQRVLEEAERGHMQDAE
jgi:hypothetical protein